MEIDHNTPSHEFVVKSPLFTLRNFEKPSQSTQSQRNVKKEAV